MTQPMPRGDLTAEAGTGLLVLVGGRAHVRGMAPVARPAFRQRKSTPGVPLCPSLPASAPADSAKSGRGIRRTFPSLPNAGINCVMCRSCFPRPINCSVADA